MKRIFLLFPLCAVLFSGCISKGPIALAFMEKELEQAVREQDRAEERVLALQVSLAREQIAFIRREIEDVPFSATYEDLEEQELFLEHREKLAEIIAEMPNCADEAQKVLDEILALITRASDASPEDEIR